MDSELEQQQPLQASHLAEELSQVEQRHVRSYQQCKIALDGVEGVGLLIQRTLMICIELHMCSTIPLLRVHQGVRNRCRCHC